MSCCNEFVAPAIPPQPPIKSRQGSEDGDSEIFDNGNQVVKVVGIKIPQDVGGAGKKRLLLPDLYPLSQRIFSGSVEDSSSRIKRLLLPKLYNPTKLISQEDLLCKVVDSSSNQQEKNIIDKEDEMVVQKKDTMIDETAVLEREDDIIDKIHDSEVLEVEQIANDNIVFLNEDAVGGLKREKLTNKEEGDDSGKAQMAKLALQYRNMKRKNPSKFTLVSKNLYPSCACRSLKNGCKTAKCTCIYFDQECQESCGCSDGCQNMDLTQGRKKRIKIGTSQVHGEGCFSMEKIQKGEYVAEYHGEIVSRADQDNLKTPSKFLFEIGDKDYLLDGSRCGSELAKMNHRPEKGANCEFKLKRVAGEWRVGAWALKDIEIGEELFAYYGDSYRGHGLITPYIKKIQLV